MVFVSSACLIPIMSMFWIDRYITSFLPPFGLHLASEFRKCVLNWWFIKWFVKKYHLGQISIAILIIWRSFMRIYSWLSDIWSPFGLYLASNFFKPIFLSQIFNIVYFWMPGILFYDFSWYEYSLRNVWKLEISSLPFSLHFDLQ